MFRVEDFWKQHPVEPENELPVEEQVEKVTDTSDETDSPWDPKLLFEIFLSTLLPLIFGPL